MSSRVNILIYRYSERTEHVLRIFSNFMCINYDVIVYISLQKLLGRYILGSLRLNIQSTYFSISTFTGSTRGQYLKYDGAALKPLVSSLATYER